MGLWWSYNILSKTQGPFFLGGLITVWPSSSPNLKSHSANERAFAIESAKLFNTWASFPGILLSFVFLVSFILISFLFPFLFFVSFLESFHVYLHPYFMHDAISVCVQYTVVSADVLLYIVLVIDPDPVTAKYEAVTEQLHLYSCWCYLLSPFKTERG